MRLRNNFTAPPARQASGLAGIGGFCRQAPLRRRFDPISVPKPLARPPAPFRIPAPGVNDLPLTRALRPLADPIALASVVTAAAALLLFVVPLLVR